MPVFCCIPDLPIQRMATTSEYINHSSALLWAVWAPVVTTPSYHPSPISLEHHLSYVKGLYWVGYGGGNPYERTSGPGVIKYQIPYYPEGYRAGTTDVKKEVQLPVQLPHPTNAFLTSAHSGGALIWTISFFSFLHSLSIQPSHWVPTRCWWWGKGSVKNKISPCPQGTYCSGGFTTHWLCDPAQLTQFL